MSYVRSVKTTFWEDSKIVEISSDAKLLFLYFITSPQSNITGCYEISMPVIRTYTGLSKEKIDSAIDELEKNDVIRYDRITHEILVVNFHKHNWGSSDKVKTSVKNCAAYIKNSAFSDFVLAWLEEGAEEVDIPPRYSIDTLSIGYEEGIDTVSVLNRNNSVSESISKQSLKKQKPKTEKKKSTRYGTYQHVIIPDSEISKLREEFPTTLDAWIEDVDMYCEKSGKEYKNAAVAIRQWAKRNPSQHPEYGSGAISAADGKGGATPWD